MFKQLKLKNESGLALLVVIITVFVIMIFALGTLSMNISETKLLEGLANDTVATQLGMWYYWKYYYGAIGNGTYANTIDTRVYTVDVLDSGGPPPVTVTITVNY